MIRTFTDLTEWKAAADARGLFLFTDHEDEPTAQDAFQGTEAREPGAQMDGDGYTPCVGWWNPPGARWPGSRQIGWLADTADEFLQFIQDL